MTFDTVLRSPFVRVPFLVFAVVSSVATSAPNEPQWSVDAAPIEEDITIAPNTSTDRKIDYEGSRPVSLLVEASGDALEKSRLHIELDDSNGGGGDAERGFEATGSGRWLALDGNDQVSNPYAAAPTAGVSATGGARGTSSITITNESSAELKLHLKVRASVGGSGETTPKGEYATAKVVP